MRFTHLHVITRKNIRQINVQYVIGKEKVKPSYHLTINLKNEIIHPLIPAKVSEDNYDF